MENYSVCWLDRSHHRRAFSCGISVLDQYIQEKASQDMKRSISVTYVIYDAEYEQVAGYYTLSSASIELGELDDALSKKLPKYPYIPATLIGRLAVDITYQKKGLGELLLINGLKRAYQASHDIASTVIIVEAINNEAKEFYMRYGFELYSRSASKLYMPMMTLKSLF